MTGAPEPTGGEGESLGSRASTQTSCNTDASRPSLGRQTFIEHFCAACSIPGTGTQQGMAQRSPPQGGQGQEGPARGDPGEKRN